MGEGKKYFWLKLKDDFFTSKRIKKLRRMAGGDTYTIIYLKMQLKAIKSDGVLTWDGLEDNIASELALDLDESEDDVKMTLAYLLSCGLAETDDSISYFFPFAVENTGTETSAAKRMREMRQRNNVTPMLHERYGEKDIDTEQKKNSDEEKNKSEKKKADAFSEFAGENADLLSALKDFEKMRKSIGKPLTERAKTMLLNKLQTFPPSEWIPILDQSIFHNWQGIFELKDTPKTGSGKAAEMLNDFYGMATGWADEQN